MISWEKPYRKNIGLCEEDWRVFEEIARKVLMAINPSKINIPIHYGSWKIEIGEPEQTDSINSLKENEVRKFNVCLSYIQYQCGKQTLEYNPEGYETNTGFHIRLQYTYDSIKQFVSFVKNKNDSFIEKCIQDYFKQFNYFLIFTKKIMEKISFPSNRLFLRLNDQGKFIIDISIEFQNIEQKNKLHQYFQDTFSMQPKPHPKLDEYCCYVLLDEVISPLSEEEQKQMDEVISLESQKNQFYYQIDLILDFPKRLERIPLSKEERVKAENEAKEKANEKTNELEQYKDILPKITKRAAENAEEKPLSYAIKCGGNLYLITKLTSLGCEALPREFDTLISDAKLYSTPSVVRYFESEKRALSSRLAVVTSTPPVANPIEKTTNETTQNQNSPASSSIYLGKNNATR